MSNSTDRLAGRLGRITTVSQKIAAACGIFMVLLPAGLAVYVFGFFELLSYHPHIAPMDIPEGGLSSVARTALYAAIFVGMVPALYALSKLKDLFSGYASGAVFSIEAANRLKAVAIALLAMVLIRPISGMLVSLAISIDLPPGGRALVITFGSTELWIGLAGAMVLVTAWIMGEAAALEKANAALADENKSFV